MRAPDPCGGVGGTHGERQEAATTTLAFGSTHNDHGCQQTIDDLGRGTPSLEPSSPSVLTGLNFSFKRRCLLVRRREQPNTSHQIPAYQEPLTKYEKIRAQNIIRNNQVLERLGVNALALLVNNVGAKRKGACNKQEEVSKMNLLESLANEELVGLRRELHIIKLQAQESKALLAKQSHEIESLRKTTEETNGILRRLLSLNKL
ncbi:hypothetical protein ACP70R_000140 [Stipagrostis hirtigluma subsp. patula]